MRRINRYIGILALSFPALMFGAGGENGTKKYPNRNGLAAGCSPASNIIRLNFNNVNTRVEAGGLWWQDRANGVADYEVPAGSNSYAIYAGGLWLAGLDVNGQLKAAASKFGQGVDYWTGPLDSIGLAEVDAETCSEYDGFFNTKRAEVATFVAYNRAVEAGTAEIDFPDYQVPKSILDWPGNGDPRKNEAFRLAPYINVGGDASYEPEEGDYPNYDLEGTVDCRAPRKDRSESSRRPLFGDENFWWIFNDKGNLHTETNAPSIGMEIHGQAFAFATSDEVNDMTFYNFELINRSTFTLTDTYFASYVDPDVGNSADDYVGCDVNRGLGYCYNGDDFDESVRGQTGYGSTPAAIGIDFFEGPFQDADGINNYYGVGPGEALNGLGYWDTLDVRGEDTIIDNERFGMRRFVYYNIGSAQNGDPSLAIHYYNYMRGLWKNGQAMQHGGDGLNSPGVEQGTPTFFMFPGDSDPLHWGTTDPITGLTTVPQNLNWTEDNPGVGEDRNDEGDRRFLQSAGPFTLEPGNVNDITVGVVFAQAESGGRLASVEQIFTADDKAQALFDNCFQVLSGPDAPDVTVQELNQELVFYLTNPDFSNNANEAYEESDPNIVTPDTLLNQNPPLFYDDKYRFQGYQVYQLAGPGISISDLGDPDKARIAFQCDIRDEVVDITNFTFDEDLEANIPETKVIGSNSGIRHSFKITEDLFAAGNNRLINFKTYYFLAIAYGHNEFKPYAQGIAPDLENPFAPAFDGQKIPYISSRSTADGGSVKAFTAIPHDPTFEALGTEVNSAYGDLAQITRLQGQGNGGQAIRLSQNTINNLFADPDWNNPDSLINELEYIAGEGPFNVKVIDPLNVIDGTFNFELIDERKDPSVSAPDVTDDSTGWKMWLVGGGPSDTIFSDRFINEPNEQLLLNPNWGLSIEIEKGSQPGNLVQEDNNGLISSTIEFKDPSKVWLGGIPDSDQEVASNWILAGTFSQSSEAFNEIYNDYIIEETGLSPDPDENFESIIFGTWGPYRLCRYRTDGPGAINAPANDKRDVVDLYKSAGLELASLNSVTIVITNDKSKWSRVPVIETNDLNNRMRVKTKLSVDKDGNEVDTTGYGNASDATIEDSLTSDDENDAGYISAFGMGWFPGYAINKETGERMNMAFGEDSEFGVNNGNDMLWNPTSNFIKGVGTTRQVWGGKHFVYVFRKTLPEEERVMPRSRYMPTYDSGAQLKNLLGSNSKANREFGWFACTWVNIPMLIPGQELLATDVEININVNKEFAKLESDFNNQFKNDGMPVYQFSTNGLGVRTGQIQTLSDELDRINIVPNPYYAVSRYEETQVDNVAKLTNLPENCIIKIYNMNGTLIRTYNKADPLNFLDWDLKNQVGIPVSSGVYIIHVDVPGIGEKILKWFGVMRPVDLNNF